jgi:hypothetical protein
VGVGQGVGDRAGSGTARKLDEDFILEALVWLLHAVNGEAGGGENQ